MVDSFAAVLSNNVDDPPVCVLYATRLRERLILLTKVTSAASNALGGSLQSTIDAIEPNYDGGEQSAHAHIRAIVNKMDELTEGEDQCCV